MTHISHVTCYISNHIAIMHTKFKKHDYHVTTDNLSKVTKPTVTVTTHNPHMTIFCNPSDPVDILCANIIQHSETPEFPTSNTTVFSYISECITKFFSNAFRYESSTTNRTKIARRDVEMTTNKPCWTALTFLVLYHGWDPPKRQARPLLTTVLFRLWWHHGINALGRARSCCVDGDYLLLHATYSRD